MVDGAIDAAFLDRADMKIFLGPPNFKGCYNILRSCLVELGRVGIIANAPGDESTALSLNFEEAEKNFEGDDEGGGGGMAAGGAEEGHENKDHLLLKAVAVLATVNRMSGRSLRKAPFLCYSNNFAAHRSVTCETFLMAMGGQLKVQSGKVGEEF